MKQSKIGMIGCGMISEVYAKNITERFGDLQLVACADLRMEAAQARAEQFGTKAMTVDVATFAQSLSEKPVKGMLTGPVTILQWSFVRNDQARATTAMQIALAIRDEVADLETAGISDDVAETGGGQALVS